MTDHTYPSPEYPANSNLSPAQFNILNTLKKGDIVSFRQEGKKGFGKRHTVVSVDRRDPLAIHVDSLPLKDTRKTKDNKYVTNEHSYSTPNLKGMIYTHSFYPNHPEGYTPHEIRKH